MAAAFNPYSRAESPFVELTESDKGSTSAEFSSAINPSSLRCKIVLDSIAESSESKRPPKPINIPINTSNPKKESTLDKKTDQKTFLNGIFVSSIMSKLFF